MNYSQAKIIDNNLNTQPCSICGSRDSHLYCQKEGFKIIKCHGCGCGFLDRTDINFDQESFYQSYYNKNDLNKKIGYNNYFLLERSLKLTFQKRIRAILKHLNSNNEKKTLLDIGCGPGFFLEEASKYFETYGVEISKSASDFATNCRKLKVINSGFRSGLFEPDKFDVVTMWDTLEHMDNPQRVLTEVAEVTKKSGLLIFTTGDFNSFSAWFFGKNWHLLNLPEHLFFFNQKCLKHLFDKTGFEILHLSYPYAYYTIAYMIERLAKSFGRSYQTKQHYLNNFFNKVIVPFNLFDIMFVICRKKG